MMDKKTHFGLSKAEFDNLMLAVRYGVIIVITVLITFTVVAGITRLIGFTPPPTGSQATVAPTLAGD